MKYEVCYEENREKFMLAVNKPAVKVTEAAIGMAAGFAVSTTVAGLIETFNPKTPEIVKVAGSLVFGCAAAELANELTESIVEEAVGTAIDARTCARRVKAYKRAAREATFKAKMKNLENQK